MIFQTIGSKIRVVREGKVHRFNGYEDLTKWLNSINKNVEPWTEATQKVRLENESEIPRVYRKTLN